MSSQPANQLLEQLGIYKGNPFIFEEYIKIYTRWNKGKPLPKPINYLDYTIIAAITQSDKNIISGGINGTITFRDADIGAGKDKRVSIVSLDMNIMDTANFKVLNGLGSSNSIAIYGEGFAVDLGGKIKAAGAYFSFSHDRSEGTHQAIRALVQLNTIEVLSKLAKVPYQQCLSPDGIAKKTTYPLATLDNSRSIPVPLPTESKKSTASTYVSMSPAKNTFQLNDILTFNAEVKENAYVNCFYQNYQGRI